MTKREFYDRLEQSAFIDSLDNCCRIETNLSGLIYQIFNDHEELTDKLHKAYAEADYECKALSVQLAMKNEQITELNHTVSGLNEMYLEAKEEIERLKIELDNMCNGYNDTMAWKSVKHDDVFDTFDSEEIERVKEAMQEFVNRCEKGEAIRSRYTYYKFKELLKDKK